MPRPLRVFLCHASQDKPAVWRIHRFLTQRGVKPWLDQADLLPGQNWEVEIPKALFASDVILVCLSKNSVNKEGYFQKEIVFALDKAMEKPQGTIFIIPVKLEDCEVPKRLSPYQWVDYFRPSGRRRLLLSLYVRAEGLGEDISPVILDVTRKTRPAFRYTDSDIENKYNVVEKTKSEEEHDKVDSELPKKNSREFGKPTSKAKDEPKSRRFQIDFKPPFFISWTDMFIWLGVPLISLVLASVYSGLVAVGYNFISMDKTITQILIWIVLSIFVALYIRSSYYYVMENERLVVFFAGKPIGERGPGHILLSPFLYFGINKVDLKEKSNDIKNEKCATRDLIVVNVGLYITWQINDPILSLTKISELEDSMLVLSTAILRTSIAEFTVQETKRKKQEIKTLVHTRIENIAKNWGVQINNLELDI